MKILFDQNISFRIISKLKENYPLINHVKFLGLENASDMQIWHFAKEHDYTIITFDADFYDLNILFGFPPKIIWIRTGNMTTKNIENLFIQYYDSIKHFIENSEENGCLEILNF